MRPRTAIFALLVIAGGAIGAAAILAAQQERDPRAAFAEAQRELIARVIGSRQDFISSVDARRDLVRIDNRDPDLAYVTGSYATRLARPGEGLDYQMRVRRFGGHLLPECFRLLDEIAEGADPCF